MSVSVSPSLRASFPWPALIGAVALFAGFRALLYWILLAIFNGWDPVNDTGTFFEMAADPVRQYLGALPDSEQFPPLFGFLFSPLILIDAIFASPSISLRVFLAVIESAVVLPFFLKEASSGKFSRAFLFMVLPPTAVTAAVFAQDEILSALFMIGILALSRSRYREYAPGVAAFAFVAVKILFGPLVAFLLLVQRARPIAYVAPVLIVVLGYLGRLGYYAEMQNYVPPNTFGVSLWSLNVLWDVIDRKTMRDVSLVLLGSVSLAFCWLWWRRSFTEAGALYSLVCYYLIGFAVFYVIGPEYYLVPFAVVLSLYAAGTIDFGRLALYSAIFTAPFIPNVINGLKKSAFASGPLGQAIPLLQDVAIVLLAVLMALVAAHAWRLSRSDPGTGFRVPE